MATTQSASAKYTLNSKGIPTDLAAYGNGKIPSNALQEVGEHRAQALGAGRRAADPN